MPPPLPRPLARVISSVPDLAAFIGSIHPWTHALYLRAVGNRLGSAQSTFALLTILVHDKNSTLPATPNANPPPPTPVIIDLKTLGAAAFTTPAPDSPRTLPGIIRNPRIPKYFWGLESAAVALQHHRQVRIAHPIDLRLLERASRGDGAQLQPGLEHRIKRDLSLDPDELRRWAASKKALKGCEANPERWERLFGKRPLPDDVVDYCAGEVMYLPWLRDLYMAKLADDEAALVQVAKESDRLAEEGFRKGYGYTWKEFKRARWAAKASLVKPGSASTKGLTVGQQGKD